MRHHLGHISTARRRSSAFLLVAVLLLGCAPSADPSPSSGPSPSSSQTRVVDPPRTDALPAAELPATELTAKSRLYDIPYEAGSVGVSRRAVWVIPHKDPVVVRIDPESGDTRSFKLPGVGAELDATDDELWMSLSVPTSFEPLALARFDPTKGRISERIDKALFFPAVVGDHVFAGNQSGLHVFHRETGAAVDVVTEDVGSFIGWAAVADYVWLVGADRAVRIDAKSLETEDVTAQLGDDVPFALAGGRYWARTPLGGLASYARDLSDRRVYAMPGEVFPDAAVIDEDLYVAVIGESAEDANMLVRIDTSLDEPVSAVLMPDGRSIEYGIDSDRTCLYVPILRTPQVYRACPKR